MFFSTISVVLSTSFPGIKTSRWRAVSKNCAFADFGSARYGKYRFLANCTHSRAFRAFRARPFRMEPPRHCYWLPVGRCHSGKFLVLPVVAGNR